MIPVKRSIEVLALLALFVFLAAVIAVRTKSYRAASLLFALLGALTLIIGALLTAAKL